MAKENFEQSMEKLEELVEKLEGGELSLDESLKKFEEGIELYQACKKKISRVGEENKGSNRKFKRGRLRSGMKYLIFLLLFSCAHKPLTHDLDSTGLNPTGDKTLKIEEGKILYGPSGEGYESESSDKKFKEPIVGLILYPTMYHSLAVIYELKKIEEKNIKVSVVSSFGFGAIITALYAKKRSVSYVEWKLFALMKKLESKKIYGRTWLETVDTFIETEFGNDKANQYPVLLAVPELYKKELKINYTGKVAKILKKTIRLEESYLRAPKEYKVHIKNKFSTDFIKTSAYLPVTPVIKNLESFKYGIYTRYLGELLLNRETFGLITTPTKSSIDEISQINQMDEIYGPLIDDDVEGLEKLITQWKELNSASLNN